MSEKQDQLKQNNSTTQFDDPTFFEGGGRGRVLQLIIEGLSNKVDLIQLCGESGSGKTDMCRMLQKKLRASREVIFVEITGEDSEEQHSFLQVISGDKEPRQIKVNQLAENVSEAVYDAHTENGLPLLIIDDVEKLPAAVLAQVLQLASDQQNQSPIQLLLSGKLPLGANPELHSDVLAVPPNKFTYTLQPLNFEDTRAYIEFQLGSAQGKSGAKEYSFSAEATLKVYEKSKGNMEGVSSLADNAISNAIYNNSDTILVEHVAAASDVSTSVSAKLRYLVTSSSTSVKVLVCATVIIFSATLMYRILFVDDKSKLASNNEISSKEKESSFLVERLTSRLDGQPQVSTPSQIESDKKKSIKVTGGKKPVKVDPNPDQNMDETPVVSLNSIPDSGGEKVNIISDQKPKDQSGIASPKAIVAEDKKVQTNNTLQKSIPSLSEVQALIPSTSGKSPGDAAKNSDELQRESDGVKREAPRSKITILRASKKVKARSSSAETAPKPQDSNVRQSAQELYLKRAVAGERWLKENKKGLYTLQLMVLKAKTAERNMRQILNQNRYRQHAENFYIVRKSSDPEMVFVFYGEYKNMDTARLALQSIPEFLKAHQPYTIPIKEAMDKIR